LEKKPQIQIWMVEIGSLRLYIKCKGNNEACKTHKKKITAHATVIHQV